MAYDISRKHPRVRGDSVDARNANFAEEILIHGFGLGENYPVRIIGEGEDLLPEFYQTLKGDPKFSIKYKVKDIGEEFEVFDGTAQGFLVEPTEKNQHGGFAEINRRSSYPGNHLLSIWHGRATSCTDLALDLAEVLGENGLPASYGLDSGKWGILEGAVYDPSF